MSTVSRIFGVPIEGPSEMDVLKKIEEALTGQKSCWIVTANPEILLYAHRDKTYASVLKQADVRTVDGFGLWVLLRLSGHLVYRLTGIDLAQKIVEQSIKQEKVIGFIGGFPDSARVSVEKFQKQIPGAKIFFEEGGRVNQTGEDDARGEEARHRLILNEVEVLLVGFGHPKQERWIARYMADFPKLKMIMGVGGTFDVWAGRLSRAPKWMRLIGFEWLWRFILEPRRIGRILRAVFAFPFYFLLDKKSKH